MPTPRRWIGLLGVLLWVCTVQAQPVPTLSGRVVDGADVLDASTEQTVTELLAAHEAATGNQIAVLTVVSLDGYSVEEYATEVFNAWGLGRADRDNGVLILIARDDREMRIEVGYGLEDPLTDSRAGRIIRSAFVPNFRNGDYDAGTLQGIEDILGVLGGTYEPPDVGGGGGSSDEIPIFVRLVFGLMFCLMPLLLFVPSFLVAGQPGGLVFSGIFIVAGSGIVTASITGALVTLVVYVLALVLAEVWLRRQKGIVESRAEVRKALEENRGRRVDVTIGGMTVTLGGITQGSGGGGGGGGFSSGGGGGFSGGGGSSGGGGASGSW